MLLLDFAGTYFLPKITVSAFHWYQENSITHPIRSFGIDCSRRHRFRKARPLE